jgi:hypothetical protein
VLISYVIVKHSCYSALFFRLPKKCLCLLINLGGPGIVSLSGCIPFSIFVFIIGVVLIGIFFLFFYLALLCFCFSLVSLFSDMVGLHDFCSIFHSFQLTFAFFYILIVPNSRDFIAVFHHGGVFVSTSMKIYIEGVVNYYDKRNINLWPLQELNIVSKDLGY